jgi:hypothetical protein
MMWEWFYYGYVATCMDDYIFVSHMDFSFHCNNPSTWKQHVFEE